MDNNDYLESDFEPDFGPGFDSEDREPSDFQPKRRRFRLNPRHSKLRNTKKHRHLPAKPTKEMSVRKARRLLFGSRTPGRPSKTLSNQLKQAKRVLQNAGEPLRRKNPKIGTRTRGRPKKLITVKKEKRPRGRPRKTPTVIKPKRPRGRPKKPVVVSNKVKRPRGRPRKNPLQQLVDNVKERRKKNPEKPSKDEA
jgi:hypothetical protein